MRNSLWLLKSRATWPKPRNQQSSQFSGDCKEHVQKISETLWPICKYYYFHVIYWTMFAKVLAKLIIFYKSCIKWKIKNMAKVPLFYHSRAKSIFQKWPKKKDRTDVQSFGRVVKNFEKFFSADNLQDKCVIWSEKIFDNQYICRNIALKNTTIKTLLHDSAYC